ncbi:hypothetical protein [Hymenobacter rigui]|uniref:HEAT repeat domain-containing protein n=1 Tax=Hymenobacter rigui TaxID=334424 RepID=A0A428KUI1_9BACT|nr:hypothetical protein [Hymenobacter rigui]RSK50232.1 hypothetical protein EI291_06150 [Hymenobacter rigui]
MMYRLFTLLVMLFLSRGMWAQDRHQAFIKRVTDTIAHVGVVKCEAVSRIGYTPRQYIRFDSLRRYCSSTELQALLEHKSPAVRGYAFWALSERPEVDLYLLMLRHRRDTDKFDRQCGCFTSTYTVVGFILLKYRGSRQFAQDTLSAARKTTYQRMAYVWSRQQDRYLDRGRNMSWAQKRRLIEKNRQLDARNDF